MGIAGGEKNPLGDLLQSGDVGKAAQMAYAVLSLVDTSEGQIGAGDKKSVITQLILMDLEQDRKTLTSCMRMARCI